MKQNTTDNEVLVEKNNWIQQLECAPVICLCTIMIVICCCVLCDSIKLCSICVICVCVHVHICMLCICVHLCYHGSRLIELGVDVLRQKT